MANIPTDHHATLASLRVLLADLNAVQEREQKERSELYALVGILDNSTSDRLRMIQHYRDSIRLLEAHLGVKSE